MLRVGSKWRAVGGTCSKRPLTRKRGGENSCVTCQDSITYFMGAFEDRGFIIVGLDTEGAQ